MLLRISHKTRGKGKGVVFVAMSGGVDSSVAALLLKQERYDVVGIFMKCFNLDGCAERDAEDARRVAEHIGIPFYVWDFEDEYKKRVVEYMIDGYRKGITPNPDIVCNKEIKFGLFLQKALRLGASYVATGHYVKLITRKERLALYAARDKKKDQSYFLWTLTQEQLKHCLFPIGDYLKPEVRSIARKANLPTAEKKDSQGICFLGKITLGEFLKQYIPQKEGVVLNAKGDAIGKHDGAHFYTIGQRRGIGNVKHQKGNSVHVPVYVAGKNIMTNTVTVAESGEYEAFAKKEVKLANTQCNSTPSSFPLGVLVRVRYRQTLTGGEIQKEGDEWKLVFKKPQKFVAPGQSAVFYSNRHEVLGGGIIV